jgi:hypothetical protein
MNRAQVAPDFGGPTLPLARSSHERMDHRRSLGYVKFLIWKELSMVGSGILPLGRPPNVTPFPWAVTTQD